MSGFIPANLKPRLYGILAFLLLLTFPEQGQIFKIPVGGFHLFAFRIILFGTFALVVFNGDLRLTGRYAQWFSIVLLVWMAYAAISLLWVRSLNWALYDIAYLAIALLTFLTLSSLFMSLGESYTPFVRGWLLAFAVLAPVAAWEIITGDHLEGKWLEHSQTQFIDHPNRFMPATTFGNPNDYASFLVMTTPLLLVVFPRKPLILGAAIMAVGVLCYFTSSRIALVALAVQGLTLLALAASQRLRPLALQGAALLLVAAGAFGAMRFKGGGVEDLRPKEEHSGSIRMALVQTGWYFFTESRGLGVGAGNFEQNLEERDIPYPKPHVRNPHNWYIEVLSEYGALIFLGLAAFVAALGMRSVREAFGSGNTLGLFCIVTITGYLVIACLSSTFMNKLFNWIPLSALVIACDQLRKRNSPT